MAGAALYQTCSACHGINGEGNRALNAPKLAGQKDWYLKRQLNYFKSGVRGSADNDVFGKQMAPMAALLVDDKAIKDVVAYITSLSDIPSSHTVDGDIDSGEGIYLTCEKCHGRNGMGSWSQNAPRLAGMSDWYMAVLRLLVRRGQQQLTLKIPRVIR